MSSAPRLSEPNYTAMDESIFALPAAARTSTLSEFLPVTSDLHVSFSYQVLKRGLDIVLILLSFPLLLLLFALIAAAIRISTPGPIFFGHRRICRDGLFTMWKFRTMCVNSREVLDAYLEANPQAHAEWSKNHKLRNDPRVTPIGEFLRRTSLDELPQLWNVLIGTMSLVEKYGVFFADYCQSKPGVTGLWQVSGRSRTGYAERIQLDVQYVRNWTLRGDFMILVKTVSVVVNQDGAY